MNEENNERVVLIDQIRPILTEEQPKGTAITLYCVNLISFFCLGGSLSVLQYIDYESFTNPYGVAALLIFIVIIISALALLSTLSFIKRFKKLTTPLNVNKESQKETPTHAPQSTR